MTDLLSLFSHVGLKQRDCNDWEEINACMSDDLYNNVSCSVYNNIY